MNDLELDEDEDDAMIRQDKVNLAGFHFQLNLDDNEDGDPYYCTMRMVMTILIWMLKVMMIPCMSETRLIWRAFTLTLF